MVLIQHGPIVNVNSSQTITLLQPLFSSSPPSPSAPPSSSPSSPPSSPYSYPSSYLSPYSPAQTRTAHAHTQPVPKPQAPYPQALQNYSAPRSRLRNHLLAPEHTAPDPPN